MSIETIPLKKLYKQSYTALNRLQIYVTGRTHTKLNELAQDFTRSLTKSANAEGMLTVASQETLRRAIQRQWRTFFDGWQQLLEGARREAILIQFGPLARYHHYYFGWLKTESFAVADPTWLEAVPGIQVSAKNVLFEPQLQALLDATANHVYGDGFKLSQRLWKLDQDSLATIQAKIKAAITNGTSAWELAKQLERYLGAGQDCPRWVSARLQALTKRDIVMGDQRGLVGSNPCGSTGVAYNALRLARNEINLAYQQATDELLKQQPWVQFEQIHLSPAHPKIDRCDDIVNGGRKSRGIYPIGTILLPSHVNCLCYKTGVLMKGTEFKRRLRGWFAGSQQWPEMDSYAEWLGVQPRKLGGLTSLVVAQLAFHFMTWLRSDPDELAEILP